MAEEPRNSEVNRELLIAAPIETVFSFFTDNERFAAWWGAGSRIEARVGGAVSIVNPDKSTASGKVLEFEPPRRIVFSFGFDKPGASIAAGASKVAVVLSARDDGTLLKLRHYDVPSKKASEEYVQGWRYQLAVFSAAASKVAQAHVDARADEWFAAWNEQDAAKCEALLKASCAAGVAMRDAYSACNGIADLVPHIAAAQMHMPGMLISRDGTAQVCHGNALVRWQVKRPDGVPVAKGVNACKLAPDGRFTEVVGFWQG